jgi:hypothetical protein
LIKKEKKKKNNQGNLLLAEWAGQRVNKTRIFMPPDALQE